MPFLPVTPALRKLISANAAEEELLAAAKREGVTFLFEYAWNKVKDGITTIEEVMTKVPVTGC